MKKLILFLTLISPFVKLKATETYAVYFKDKANSTFSINAPENFLSKECLERRKREHMGITTLDLPVSECYLQAIEKTGVKILYSIKFMNLVVVEIPDHSAIDFTQKFSFVLKQELLSDSKVKADRNKKLEEVENNRALPCDCDTLKFSDIYGAATNQNQMIRVDALHGRGYWGDSVIVAVFDAGFYHADSTIFFDSTFAAGRVLYKWDVVSNEQNVFDNDMHGAYAWSCIAANIPGKMIGTAPHARFLLFRTENEASETIQEEYNWAYASEVAENKGAAVFSTSLGYTTFDLGIMSHSYADMNGHSTPITKAANRAASLGVLVVNSAGNEGDKGWHYIAAPADGDSVLAVGAVTRDRQIAGFSSRGPNYSGQVKPDVCAQGNPAAIGKETNQVGYANGTSFSGPIMAGAVACLRGAFPSRPNMEILQAVKMSGHVYHQSNESFGYGIPDFNIAYQLLKDSVFTDLASSSKSTIRVFPNPFSEQLNVFVQDISTATYTFQLIDMSGKRVYENTATLCGETYQIIAITDVADIPAGSYILRVLKGNVRQEIRVQKI